MEKKKSKDSEKKKEARNCEEPKGGIIENKFNRHSTQKDIAIAFIQIAYMDDKW